MGRHSHTINLFIEFVVKHIKRYLGGYVKANYEKDP